MKCRRLLLCKVLFVVTIAGHGLPKGYGAGQTAKTDIPFHGDASGGELILAGTLGRNSRHFSIITGAGESSESVARRLAQSINQTNPFRWSMPKAYMPVKAREGTLEGLIGSRPDYIIAGSENGLGVPEPPLSLSCSYEPEGDKIFFRWENPAYPYDSILILMNWTGYDNRGAATMPGTSTSYVIDRKKRPVDVNDLDIWVIGYRDNVPSNAAAVHLNGASQEELYGIPFTDNIAPNWRAWLMTSDKDAVVFEQGVRERFLPRPGYHNGVDHPATKPFYQLIKVESPGAMAGVWRKFLGLTGGHTYRVAARISTLEMDSVPGNWSFSLHAAHNPRHGGDLTVAQLAGLAALPDGSTGEAAGQIALYNQNLTTNRTWEERSTGKSWRGLVAPDITLPQGADTITVWVRCRADAPGAFGIDWVKLEDLTAARAQPTK